MKPVPPRLVLLAAILLPGVGHVLAGRPGRGLVIAFSTLLFGLLTALVADPSHSFVGRHAGGFFVWAISILDAYRSAKLRQTEAVGAAAG